MDGRTAIANILKREGVEFITCFPSNSLIDACASVGIRPIMARTERIAIHIADGFSRVTGGKHIGVAMMQGNPGIENSFAGVAFAYQDNSPILLLPDHVGKHRLGIQPDFSVLNNYRGVTKWVEHINMVERVPEYMRRAFTKLRNGKRGPVLLELPRDVADAQIDEAAFYYTPVKTRRSQADPHDVKELASALVSARAPMIQAGQGVLYAEATPELVELAELLQAPVTTTLPGKSAFPEDHPLYCGSGSRTASKAVAAMMKKADLYFGVGTSFTRNQYNAPIPSGKSMAQVTVDESDVNKDVNVSYGAIGDAKLVLRQLIDEVKSQLGPNGRRGQDATAKEIKALRDEWLKEWMPRLTSSDTPISPYRVIWE
ncbi:MAG: thiamine pyrophosphate-binding protein, partial [Chloroflexota bacterium]|nr:thiamine pyrophosphate-binding protein [Chloroflexota bacterium]